MSSIGAALNAESELERENKEKQRELVQQSQQPDAAKPVSLLHGPKGSAKITTP